MRVRKKNGVLSLVKPSADAQQRARALAAQVLLRAVVDGRGDAHGAGRGAERAREHPPRKKLLSALKKLALDDSTFDGNAGARRAFAAERGVHACRARA